ncbi:MAG: hypothetical protein NT069_09600 [Planctomycetota bacterium]|nr:hypothetical protein [Planctomycetota bacterium]
MNDPTRQSGTAGTFGCAFLVGLFLTGLASLAGAEPTGSAIPGNHPLTEVQAGELLISELRCTACHAGLDNASLPAPVAPDLSDAGSRIAPEFLRRFLAEPSKAHPGTSMPDLLSSRSEKERDQIAEALTHFLVERAKDYFDSRRKQPADHPEGKRLYHSVGCVACHGFRAALDEPRPAQQPDPAKGTDDDPDEPAVENVSTARCPQFRSHARSEIDSRRVGRDRRLSDG